MSEPLVPLTKEQANLVRNSNVVPRLVRRLSRKTRRFTAPELTSIGNESECRWVTKYDPARDVPYPAYAYCFVHLDMRRAIGEERDRQLRERSGLMGPGYEFLERAKDPGRLFDDTPEDQRTHVRQFGEGIFGVVLARLLSESSLPPSEDELAADTDRRRMIANVRRVVEEMGETARVLVLKYLDQMNWDEVAAKLGTSVSSARRAHDEALRLLTARVVAANRPARR